MTTSGSEIGVLAEAERRFRNKPEVIRSGSIPSIQQRRLDDLVLVSLWRHRNQLPPDQFDALVLLHDAGRDHRLHFGDGEAAARQALCGGGDAGGGGSHGSRFPFGMNHTTSIGRRRRTELAAAARLEDPLSDGDRVARLHLKRQGLGKSLQSPVDDSSDLDLVLLSA